MKIRQILNFLTLATGAVAVTFTSLWIGKQAYYWLPPQGAAESHLIDDLFSFLVTLGALIFLGVTATLLYSIAFHRAKSTDFGVHNTADKLLRAGQDINQILGK